jgi:hypothetical protein
MDKMVGVVQVANINNTIAAPINHRYQTAMPSSVSPPPIAMMKLNAPTAN